MEDDEIIDIGGEDSLESTPASVSSASIAVPTLEDEPVMSMSTWDSGAYKLETMDDDSRALIEQMLAEEEYYYGNNTLDTMMTNRQKKGAQKKKNAKPLSADTDGYTETKPKLKKLDGAISSSSMPSHKTRWTAEEDELLRTALDKYGYGNWKSISEHVTSRNPLQCKNHARHWLLSDKIESPVRPKSEEKEDQVRPTPGNTTETTVEPSLNTNENEDGEDISVEDDSPTETKPDLLSLPDRSTAFSQEKMMSDNQVASKDGSSDPKPDTNADTTNYTPLNKDQPVCEVKEKAEEEEEQMKPAPNDPEYGPIEKDIPSARETTPDMEAMDTSNESGPADGTSADDSVEHALIKPEDETMHLIFDRHVVSEEEKTENPEWFNHSHPKTPERYLKIRNHIIDCWQKCKPRYLTKTSARKGLKDCGDVNAIGRVHSYLENIRAINTNCIKSALRPPKRVAREADDDEETNMVLAADLVIGYDGPRKRKVRNEQGNWVDPKELEGRVIEHGQQQEVQTTRSKRVIRRPQHYYGGDDFGRGYDPFRLVPVLYYDEHDPAPFTVDIISDALLVMDFHSHLAETEIIGLLGGNFVDSKEGKTLKVECVFPCRSTSTGIQCEMDPTSEMKAREVFSEKGYTVVGWYHSHPTFEPQPSIRDIENQTSYQTLFRHEKTGDEPFIGVIVTPYDPEIISEHSQIQYLHISNQWNEVRSFRFPYACRKRVRQSEQVSPEILRQIRELVDEFKGYEHKIDMMSTYGSQTKLDKLLDSLRANLFLETDQVTQFLNDVRDTMTSEFVEPHPTTD